MQLLMLCVTEAYQKKSTVLGQQENSCRHRSSGHKTETKTSIAIQWQKDQCYDAGPETVHQS